VAEIKKEGEKPTAIPVVNLENYKSFRKVHQELNEKIFIQSVLKEKNELFQQILNSAIEEQMRRDKDLVCRVVNNVCNIIKDYLDNIAKGETSVSRDNAADAFFKQSAEAAEMARLFEDRAEHTRELCAGIVSTLKNKIK
jgi:hypothetical protein